MERFAAKLSIDLVELKVTTTAVFNESGKIPAFKHVNTSLDLGRPLPLLSIKKNVEQIELSFVNNQ